MDEMNSSVVDQEVAAPEQESAESTSTEVTEVSDQSAGQDNGQEQPENLSENNRWEISRRRAEKEADARVQREVQAALAQRDAEFARRFGRYVNPKTGKPIANERDYLETLDAQEEAAREKRIAETGRVTADDMRAIARKEVAAQQAELAKQAEMERMRVEGIRQLNEQMAELSRLDPTLKTEADLLKMDNFAQFDALVRNGLDLVSAYKVVNFDRAQKKTAEAAKQAAINSAKGTGHLAPVGGVGTDDQGLSDADMDVWKRFGFSSKEAREYHKKLNK